MDEELKKKLIEFITCNYNPAECEYTSDRSSGNDVGVFDDGFCCGYSTALYDAACLLGVYLEKPLHME